MWWMDIQIAPWMNLIIIIKIPSDQLQLQENIFKKNNDQQYSGIWIRPVLNIGAANIECVVS